MITMGLSGSGKTWLTQELLARCGAIRLRSDVERKRLFGLASLQRSDAWVPDGIYGEDATRRTYDALRERAAVALRAGYPTIVDATFLRRDERARFAALADELGVPFLALHCHAPAAVLEQRVQARERDASEADVAVLRRQLALQEPLQPAERSRAIDVDTARPVDMAAIVCRFLAAAPHAGDGV